MRLGKFYIESSKLHLMSAENQAEIFKQLSFVPLRVELLGYMQKYEYIGISRKFKDIPMGSLPTLYKLEIKEIEVEDEPIIEDVNVIED